MAVKHVSMAHSRSAIAFDGIITRRVPAPRRHVARVEPRRFGRGRERSFEEVQNSGWGLSDDAKLFAMTFTGGFLFVSILIA